MNLFGEMSPTTCAKMVGSKRRRKGDDLEADGHHYYYGVCSIKQPCGRGTADDVRRRRK